MSDWRTRKGANLEKPSFDDECRIPSALDWGVSIPATWVNYSTIVVDNIVESPQVVDNSLEVYY
jgi:hypothetical protein